jgi:hypothetical protein
MAKFNEETPDDPEVKYYSYVPLTPPSPPLSNVKREKLMEGCAEGTGTAPNSKRVGRILSTSVGG